MDGDGGRGEVIVDEDTCTGDSGGPMIIRKSATSPEDLQVSESVRGVLRGSHVPISHRAPRFLSFLSRGGAAGWHRLVGHRLRFCEWSVL